ncbi:uncharacterized protein LOC107304573 [Oryza brachyantha]|uniref:uncharacterized protein LOC107304573 n=1 Tax=Oryza brachyantha TaxID=4533 RepID=UPI001ADCBFCE|nr:uncharacterized protein LOC107304573 [Oryza brachyantha]
MPPPPPPEGRPAWSVTVRLRHRGWLELRAAAENVLPGWGHGGERLSLLLRLRRGLRLAVTSRCVRPPPEKNPRACRILRFLGSRLSRVPSIWRRKKPSPSSAAAIAASKPAGSRSQATQISHVCQAWQERALAWPGHGERRWPARSAAALCLVAVLAVSWTSIAAFRAMNGYGRGYHEPGGHRTPWRFLVAKRIASLLELEPRLYAWLMKLSLNRLLNW